MSIPDVHDLIPLNFLAEGDCARVGEILGASNEIHRLEELGIRREIMVYMVRAGNPCIIRVGESKLCFRDAEMFKVLVRRSETA